MLSRTGANEAVALMDPVLAALGLVVESFAVELATKLRERQRQQRRRPEVPPARVRRILSGAAGHLGETLRSELGGIPEHEWRSAVIAVRDSFSAVTPIVLDDAVALELRPERLEAYVRQRSPDVRRAAALSAAGQSAYDRILTVTCQEILRAIVGLPEFSAAVQVATFQDLQAVRRAVDGLAGGRDRPDEITTAQDFESRYLDHVVHTLGRMELFGVSRGRTPKTQSFDEAYISLAVARSGPRLGGEDDDELTGAGVDVMRSFRDHPRVLLRGGAGAGKTTLLRWLAVETSGNRFDGPSPSGQAVPFFVPLREFARRELPAPADLPGIVARVIAAETPPGWVGDRFRAGRAVLLVDGVDELEPTRRLQAREWLEQLVTAYDSLRVVVSARPFAISEDWLDASGFVTFDLLPLSAKGVRDFLTAWHNAARGEHESDPEMRDWLDDCERGLAEQLATRSDLRRMVGSPLLCGLLCALYQDRNMHLPRDRKGIYEAALDLLLVRWDEARGVQVDQWPPLSREEQVVLLQRFAYSMVKNHEMVVSREVSAQRFTHAMRGLRSQHVGPEPVLQRILERTGLLREPQPDEVQFVHRTFRDYLAAKEVVDGGDLAFVVEQAHLDHWHDVVVNAVALARPRERDWMLRRLIEGSGAAQTDVRIRNRLHLVAAACLEHADVLESAEARELVQQAAARLIPPATLDEADVLARAGTFVLDMLPGPEGLSPNQAAAVVRTAAMIGGEGVLDKLAKFVTVGESRVIDELLRAWRRSDDPEDYARTVLASVDFGQRSLEVRGWHRVRCLKHLTRLSNVVCYGDFAPLDAVAAVPRLRRLVLVQNELVRDLRPLADCPTLRILVLTAGCQFLRDLSPLAETTVEELSLHLVAADLGTLRGDRLRRLVIRDPRLADGLHPLPVDLPLRELVVDNLPRSRSLVGIDRWAGLEEVSFRGVPSAEEIEALAKLPRLRRLTVLGVGATDELAGLRASVPGAEIFTPRD
jgi:NACHT domain